MLYKDDQILNINFSLGFNIIKDCVREMGMQIHVNILMEENNDLSFIQA